MFQQRNKCGLHIHFNRKALGYNSKEYDVLLKKLNNNVRKADIVNHERANKTIENIVALMEVYQSELIKISGRNSSSINQWCRFETENGTEIKSIKMLQWKNQKLDIVVQKDIRWLIQQIQRLLK